MDTQTFLNLYAARRNLPRNTFVPLNRRATALTARAISKEKKISLVGGGNLGGILRDNLGEGNCESGIAARQRGVASKLLSLKHD